MSTLSGITQQNIPWESYVPGQDYCECGDCDVWTLQMQCGYSNNKVDWYYGNQDCCFPCPPQPICSKINPNTCPIIGGNIANIEWYDDNDYMYESSRPVVCTYPSTSIKTSQDVYKWINTFGKDETYNDVIMPNFCATLDTNCSNTGFENTKSNVCAQGLTGCSKFTANNSDGNICRDWAYINPDKYYQIAGDFCENNMCASDCLCYNRNTVDPEYVAIEKNPGAPNQNLASCWYKPCQNNDILIPKYLKTIQNTCPPSICDKISAIISSNENYNENITSCEINQNYNYPPSNKSFWDTYYIWIVVGIMVFLTVGYILLVVFIIYTNKKTSYSKKSEFNVLLV